jgi:hypothetical protein
MIRGTSGELLKANCFYIKTIVHLKKIETAN